MENTIKTDRKQEIEEAGGLEAHENQLRQKKAAGEWLRFLEGHRDALLRQMASVYGLSRSGSKREVIERLVEHEYPGVLKF